LSLVSQLMPSVRQTSPKPEGVLISPIVFALTLAASYPAPVHEAQLAVLIAVQAEAGSYFKDYCVAVNPGEVTPPATEEALMLSTRTRADPPATVFRRLKVVSQRFAPASECQETEDGDLYHRSARGIPALLVVAGQVDPVSEDHVRIVVLTSSGFLTETLTLYDLERRDLRWEVSSSRILLQA
jgi:hypothetical protein